MDYVFVADVTLPYKDILLEVGTNAKILRYFWLDSYFFALFISVVESNIVEKRFENGVNNDAYCK